MHCLQRPGHAASPCTTNLTQEHPEFDGRGIVVAILDTGIDPGAAALQTTPNGRPKIIDVLDCTGSGDVDTSTLVTAAADYTIQGVRGSALRLNPAWDNPSGKWHVGSKRLFDLVPKGLADSIRADRRRVWMQEQRDLLAKATAEVAKVCWGVACVLRGMFDV